MRGVFPTSLPFYRNSVCRYRGWREGTTANAADTPPSIYDADQPCPSKTFVDDRFKAITSHILIVIPDQHVALPEATTLRESHVAIQLRELNCRQAMASIQSRIRGQREMLRIIGGVLHHGVKGKAKEWLAYLHLALSIDTARGADLAIACLCSAQLCCAPLLVSASSMVPSRTCLGRGWSLYSRLSDEDAGDVA